MELQTKTKSFRTNVYKRDSIYGRGYIFYFQLDYIDQNTGLRREEKLSAAISKYAIEKYTEPEIHEKILKCLWSDEKIDGIKIVSQ